MHVRHRSTHWLAKTRPLLWQAIKPLLRTCHFLNWTVWQNTRSSHFGPRTFGHSGEWPEDWRWLTQRGSATLATERFSAEHTQAAANPPVLDLMCLPITNSHVRITTQRKPRIVGQQATTCHARGYKCHRWSVGWLFTEATDAEGIDLLPCPSSRRGQDYAVATAEALSHAAHPTRGHTGSEQRAKQAFRHPRRGHSRKGEGPRYEYRCF